MVTLTLFSRLYIPSLRVPPSLHPSLRVPPVEVGQKNANIFLSFFFLFFDAGGTEGRWRDGGTLEGRYGDTHEPFLSRQKVNNP